MKNSRNDDAFSLVELYLLQVFLSKSSQIMKTDVMSALKCSLRVQLNATARIRTNGREKKLQQMQTICNSFAFQLCAAQKWRERATEMEVLQKLWKKYSNERKTCSAARAYTTFIIDRDSDMARESERSCKANEIPHISNWELFSLLFRVSSIFQINRARRWSAENSDDIFNESPAAAAKLVEFSQRQFASFFGDLRRRGK